MPAMNSKSLVNIMETLDISTTQLAEELFISQSLVSKWRSGSRTLKANSAQYIKLLNYFIEVNQRYDINILEDYFEIKKDKNQAQDINLAVKKALNSYLLSYPYEQKFQKNDVFIREGKECKDFKTYIGEEARIFVQEKFWEYVLNLEPKPDVYIKELNYGLWASNSVEWLDRHHKNCIKYMNSGGNIYYFSDLNIIEKRDYYSSWEFSSHKNLYPTYYKTILSEKVGWSYFIAKDYISLSYFYPEDNPDNYYTAINLDRETVNAHYKYIQTEYDKNNKQIPIDTNEKFNFGIQICQLYKDDVNPVFYMGKFLPYIFSSKKQIRKLAMENNVSKSKMKSCMELYDFISREIMSNTKLMKQFFFYEEDIKEGLYKDEMLDIELSGIFNKPIYLTEADKEERMFRLREITDNKLYSNIKVHVVSKKNQYIYGCFREINSNVYVKYNKWCYTFAENDDRSIDVRVIQDSTACSIRYEMFDEILKKE